MSPAEKRNTGHSVFQRLLKYARTNEENFNLLLTRYGIERLLYRLSISSFADRFILKGASLFLVWKGQNYRVTRDADLLGFGPADTEHLNMVFRELCRVASVSIDGIEYLPDTVEAVPIREEQEYDGIRVTLIGVLHRARISLQIDIGYGDIITPEPEKIEFPTLLDAPPPKLLAYPRYTMIAEKLEAIVRLGMINSRMKDFYDLWLLRKLFTYDGKTLRDAVNNTFNRRSTQLPRGVPVAFTDEFRKDPQKQVQWRAFVRKSEPEILPGNLDTTIGEIVTFLMPVLNAIQNSSDFRSTWNLYGAWRKQMKM